MFLKGTHLVSIGAGRGDEGRKCINQAKQIRQDILRDGGAAHLSGSGSGEPSQDDFDELIVFWSR